MAEVLFDQYNQFSGTDEKRAALFQHCLNDPGIKAILAVRGGYGSVRIIDRIDFSQFMLNPKWIIGYSDMTVFLNHVFRQCSTLSLHATHATQFCLEYSGSVEWFV